jgi:hypothetical protein
MQARLLRAKAARRIRTGRSGAEEQAGSGRLAFLINGYLSICYTDQRMQPRCHVILAGSMSPAKSACAGFIVLFELVSTRRSV